MRELPILFSAPMVRAILEGRKTATRRVVKPQPVEALYLTHSGFSAWHNEKGRPLRDRYGQPGDQLWVRETFALEHCVEHDQEPPFTDGRPVRRRDEPGEARWVQPHYRATDSVPELRYEFGCSASCPENDPHVHWKPSIHMPRWASRITLEVTGVSVERLQDISEDDALAEGVDPAGPVGYIPASDRMGRCRYQFANLWDEINGAGNWNANPSVWVVEFKMVQS